MTAAKTDERFLGRQSDLRMTTVLQAARPGPRLRSAMMRQETRAMEGFFAALRMTTLRTKSKERLFGRGSNLGMTTLLPNAAARLLLFGIRFYQAIFAHLMPVGCKFYPSCSRYAAEAIERHGAARGGRLALARLWRCRPFTRGGFDPVPDAYEVSNGAADAASLSANDAEGGARAEVGS